MQQDELTLDEMLADPIVRQLMARDGVAEAELRGLAVHVRGRPLAPEWAVERRVVEEPRSYEA